MKKIIYIILVLIFVFFVRYENVKAISTNVDYYKIDIKTPEFDFSSHKTTCSELLGPNLTRVVKAGIKLIQVAGAIIAIVNGMITLIPAVLAKDADGLKKASKKLVMMAIILALIFIFPSLITLIGHLFNYDISCFFW